MIDSVSLLNTVTQSRININQDDGEYWLKEVDFGQVEGDIHTFKFINQPGETVYNIGLSPRQIQISGWVAAWDEFSVTRMKDLLNRTINPKHLMEAYAKGKKIGFYPRTSVVYSPTYENNNELISQFLITGYCPYPLFTDEEDSNTLVSYTTPLWRFPWAIPSDGFIFGIRQPTLIAEVNNAGDLPIGYIIEFKARGTVINPFLVDIGSQQFIKFNKTMSDGEVITVDTKEGYRKVTGSVNGIESNYFKYRTFDSSWLQLETGVNYLRYNADDGVALLEVNIIYNPAYLEVDK